MKAISLCGGLLLAVLSFSGVVSATPAALKIDSFNGSYFLSRDSHGLSLLTTKETIVADFDDSGFYGLNRQIPTSFSGHTVDVKILSVSDAAGDPLPYKTTAAGGYLNLVTGDPAVTLFGLQTFNINYQTSGVVNLHQATDEFLLDVNGRGWQGPINNVYGSLTLPSSLVASLIGQPSCYTAVNVSQSTNCQLITKRSGSNTIISAQAANLVANQTLVIKTIFKPATFNDYRSTVKAWWWAAPLVLILLIFYITRRLKSRPR